MRSPNGFRGDMGFGFVSGTLSPNAIGPDTITIYAGMYVCHVSRVVCTLAYYVWERCLLMLLALLPRLSFGLKVLASLVAPRKH